MINHKHKIIFIHIPKCAGSSIEEYFGVKPFKWIKPNYENLTGWCPSRKIHLQHATAEQLLSLNLIDKETWKNYFKFAIVRNPWARAVSDYLWFNRNKIINVSFKNYINGRGRLKKEFSDPSVKEYRGDHLISQLDFLTIDDEIAVDEIIKLENLSDEFPRLKNRKGLPDKPLPHNKKSKNIYNHYSEFYFDSEIELIKNRYNNDIEYFNYNFMDKRDKSLKEIVKRIYHRIGV